MDGYDIMQWVFVFLSLIANVIFTWYVIQYTKIFSKQKEPYALYQHGYFKLESQQIVLDGSSQ
eukprot:403375633